MNEAYRLSSTLWYISDLHVIPSWVKHALVYTIDEKMPQYVAPLCQLSKYHVCVEAHEVGRARRDSSRRSSSLSFSVGDE